MPKRRGKPSRRRALLLRLALLGLMMLAGITISTYVLNYMATYRQHTLGLPPRTGLRRHRGRRALRGMLGALLGGWLSDRFGRKPVMLGAAGAAAGWRLPCFLAMMLCRSP